MKPGLFPEIAVTFMPGASQVVVMMEPWQIYAIHKAAAIAAQAHDGQYRKDKKIPAIIHPARVAGLVQAFGGGYREVVAAWLHDVIEDTKHGETAVAYGLSSMKLPGDDAIIVYQMITALTRDRSLPEDDQLLDSLDRILQAPPGATLIKICDRIDNVLDMHTLNGDLTHYVRRSAVVLTRLFGSAMQHGYGDAHEKLRLCLELQLPSPPQE
ncbi:MAG: HD domain-containing protein [Methanolinea sp.]|nr:MAG: HD domain-containing protein [Methanolinea sp.]